MTVPYEASGRRAQKERTRAALVSATRRLFATTVTPSVEQVADEAGISRTTAYRYFPNQGTLLAAAFPEIDQSSLLPEPAPGDVRERLDLAVRALSRFTIEHEPQLRAQLCIALQSDSDQPPLRRGRAVRWLEDALAPLATSNPEVDIHHLAVAVRAGTGIESLVWLIDIAGLRREDTTELACWTARALLNQTLNDAN
jgi:AcrR family transcriptional regulator